MCIRWLKANHREQRPSKDQRNNVKQRNPSNLISEHGAQHIDYSSDPSVKPISRNKLKTLRGIPGEGYSTYYGMQREENSGTVVNILWDA